MSSIRYVVLSDLHFGATNSVLTTIRPDPSGPGRFSADPVEPTPLIDALMSGLESLVADQDEPPTLVLAGDVLDLALSPDEVAATAFGGFVDRAFGGGRPVFGPLVYFLPGNHDHHLWEGTREAAYTRSLLDLAPDAPIPPPRHTTAIAPGELAPSEGDLISTLIHRRSGCSGVEIRVAYPNLALTTDPGNRVQVLSHGHFTEPIYTLMSRLRQVLFPNVEAGETTDIEILEAENFAWIDFFWSTLGRSGEVGIDVGRIYADLQSPANLNALVTNLVTALTSRPHNPPWLRWVESEVLGAILRREVRHVARAERGSPGVVLTPAGRQGLSSYLEGPVLTQLKARFGSVPERTGFVFGHTHKPFSDTWRPAGYRGPVSIANTGGWVVDTATPAPFQGASAVLLDDELNCAEIGVYRQAAGGVTPVEVRASDPSDPLLANLRTRVDPGRGPWKTISEAAGRLVSERWQLQANLTAAPARPGKKRAQP
jgi:hypothetical protein